MSIETHRDRDLPSPGVADRRVVAVAVALMLMMLGSVAMLVGFYVWQLPERSLPAPRPLPSPQVGVDERALRLQIEAAQRQRLSGYRWANSEKTVIGIPIERAMQILAARGNRAFDPLVSPGASAPASGAANAAAAQTEGVRVPSNKEPLSAQKGARSP
jgi:hypothetical protein